VTALVFVAVLYLFAASASPRQAPPAAGPRANPALPAVTIPADNPQTDAKVALGRQLFFDPRLSAGDTISCATCHEPSMAWANHEAVDTGIEGRTGTRNSGTILDSAYMDFQFWDGRARTLEEQALGPIHNPVEMGETLEDVVRELNTIPGYRRQFREVFGGDATVDALAKAIAAFERTVLSGPSPYDRYVAGDRTAMTPAAIRGLRLFGGKARCRTCHQGPMLSDQGFHNLGVGMDRAAPDIGREGVTKDPKDRGKFKTPTLRNVALTWPYMHDGSVRTLAEVADFYNRGGVPNPALDVFVTTLDLTDEEKQQLVAFMEALTGTMPAIDRPSLPD
jgi:cytochrome c peroxidase